VAAIESITGIPRAASARVAGAMPSMFVHSTATASAPSAAAVIIDSIMDSPTVEKSKFVVRPQYCCATTSMPWWLSSSAMRAETPAV
jgi:hypothetical protein